MGIKSRISNDENMLAEKLFREESNYRRDRLVEKWSKVAEIGKGITDMPTTTARNLAVMLENQTRAMSRMTEAQLASAFNGYTPENMLRLVRLSYPNSIRGDLFTEFAMESAHDSIKYIEPVYNNVMNDVAGKTHAKAKLDDDDLLGNGIMYESQESRWATEMVEATYDTSAHTATFVEPYVDGYSVLYGATGPVAIQANGAWVVLDTANITSVAQSGNVATVTLAGSTDPVVRAVGRFDSDQDLSGEYLGEVELKPKDYHFQPRIISLGVTWTQLTELILDTSFGVSAEEMLMDYAAQEIKKTLDYQAIKYASAQQKAFAAANEVTFDAQAGDGTKDSYYHTAQLVGQAIDQIADKQLNAIGRGGVTAIVGGPKAVTYLKLNKLWSDTGKQPAIGGHKVGELDGVPVFKVPAGIVGDDELLTTWKNETAEGDVAVAIGTLMPFYTTGAIQRKNLYKEAAVARFEDMKALQPKYLGRIKIANIR